MPHGRKFLGEMVVETKKYVPGWLYASLLKVVKAENGDEVSKNLPPPNKRNKTKAEIAPGVFKDAFYTRARGFVEGKKERLILECFGGTGQSVVADFPGKHVAMEKDKSRAAAYKRKHPSTEVVVGDNLKILEGMQIKDLSWADLDASGRPFDCFEALLIAVSDQRSPFLVTTTWGFINEALKRGFNREAAWADMRERINEISKKHGFYSKPLFWSYPAGKRGGGLVVYGAFSVSCCELVHLSGSVDPEIPLVKMPGTVEKELFAEHSEHSNPDVPGTGPENAPVAFVGASLEPLEKARGEQFVGDVGLCFIKKYLEPLGLKREDVYLTSLVPKVVFGANTEAWREEQIKKLEESRPSVIVALSQEVGRGLGDLADFTLPHPAIVSRRDSGEVGRKIRQVKKLIANRQAPPIRITKADEIKRIVYGVVLDPYGDNGPEEDAHNDWNPPASVETAAHNFAKGEMVIGLQHVRKAQAKVVETWVEQYPTRVDYLAAMKNKAHSVYSREFGDEIVHSGAWLMGVELGPVEWGLFLKGEITGFSPGGFGSRTLLKKNEMPKVKIVELVKRTRK